MTSPDRIDLTPRVKMAFLDSLSEIYASLSAPVDTKTVLPEVLLDGSPVKVQSFEKADPTDVSVTNYVKITLTEPLAPSQLAKAISGDRRFSSRRHNCQKSAR